MHRFFQWLILSLLASIPLAVQANPIDWKGRFGIGTYNIDSYNRADQNSAEAVGSQAVSVPRGNNDVSYQQYIFTLSPVITVNDSITLNGEITTGYGRGGQLGDANTRRRPTNSFGNALYPQNTIDSNDRNALHLTKLYTEIYTDSGTIVMGRQPNNWGLGAIWNSGDGLWDVHTTAYDGLSAKFKVSNFIISPFWAKINTLNDLTSQSDTTEYGLTLLYDNFERDLKFGVLYSLRTSEGDDPTMLSDTTGAPIGTARIKFLDLYLQKTFGRFTFGFEVPIITGNIGQVYSAAQTQKYSANAIVHESNFRFNEKWNLGLKAGQVSGTDGGNTFKAMYLHPNYQVANLMFRYNLFAVDDPTESFFDSYITNVTYARLYLDYNLEKWKLTGAFVYAKADVTAQSGGVGFQHERNRSFAAVANQDDNYGQEVDFNFDYFWNKNFNLGGMLGYHLVGDYYAFNNTLTPQKTKNSYIFVLRSGISF